MQKDFHITIGSSSTKMTFEDDLRIVKSALLYADKIKLCSPISYESLRYLNIIEEKSHTKKIQFLEAFSSYFLTNDISPESFALIAEYKKMLKKKYLSSQELKVKIGVEKILNKTFINLKDKVSNKINELGMKPLLPLIESKILEIHSIDNPNNFNYDELIENFVTFLGKSISNQNTYPLFNDEVGKLVRLGIKSGKIITSESGVSRGKHCGLATNLLERLPLFDEAEVSEILDIRKELDRPLKRFRVSMIEFSEKIKNAAWDEDFSHDAEEVFRRKLEPSILEIEDAINSNRYLSSLVRKVVDKPLNMPAGSVFALVMSQLSGLPDLVTGVFGVGVSSSIIAYDAYKEWYQTNIKIEQNGLFFYYQAKQKLSKLND